MTTLITGSSGNLGKTSVEAFAEAGHKVFAAVSPGKALGYSPLGDVVIIQADLSDESSAAMAVNSVIVKAGRIDAALLLVGGFAMGDIEHTDVTLLRKMQALNFETAYNVARPVFQQMVKQPTGGRIVLVGAAGALDPSLAKNMVAYALSKSLVFRLNEMLNASGNRKSVHSAIVVPRTIDTPENRKAMPKADFSTWTRPEIIAQAMLSWVNQSVEGLPSRLDF